MSRVPIVLVAILANLTAPSWGIANEVTNGSFDVDVAGWIPLPQTTLTWDPADADGDPGSGSALVTGTGGFPSVSGIYQCSDALEGGADYVSRGEIFIQSGQPAGGLVFIEINVHDQLDCAGSLVAYDITPAVYSTTTDEWVISEKVVSIPVAGRSANVRPLLTKNSGSGDFSVLLDNIAVFEVSLIFADGFESGDLSQWSVPLAAGRW
jgi:hypothetical protein